MGFSKTFLQRKGLEMEKKPTELKSLKKGGFVLVDDVPCTVTGLDISRPGKHGAAKARLSAVGIFDNIKRITVKPADTRIDVPMIEKRSMQVVSKSSDTIQLMDTEDYAMKEVKAPEFDVAEGDELIVWRWGEGILIKGKK